MQTYLLNNPAAPICGANFSVEWSRIDKGPTANPQYDFSSLDAEIKPWISAGKLVDLTVWGVAYGTGTERFSAVPSYVLSQVTTLNCLGSSVAYWQAPYMKNYQAFMSAVVPTLRK